MDCNSDHDDYQYLFQVAVFDRAIFRQIESLSGNQAQRLYRDFDISAQYDRSLVGDKAQSTELVVVLIRYG